MSALSVVDVVLRPDRYFARRLGYRDAILPVLLIVGVSVALSYAYRPFFTAALASLLPPEGAERMMAIETQVFRFSLIGAMLVPLLYVAATVILAFLVLAASGVNDVPRFEGITVCVAWAAILLALKDVTRLGVLLVKGRDAVRGAADLQPGVGFGFLVAPQSVLYNVLDTINAFDLGYVFVLALAISRSERVELRYALAVAAIPWMLLQAIRIGFGALVVR
jgi:hypothetical protein